VNNNLLDSLNPQQRKAVEHVDTPLLIVAGAGSGKTKVITHKIAYLIQKNKLSPFNILGVTFTNNAANEMKARIESLIGIAANLFHLSTFHSLGLRILRESGDFLGFDRNWYVIDDLDQKKIIETITADKFEYFTNDMRETTRRKINLAKMNLNYPNNPEVLSENGFGEEELEIFSMYHNFQKKNKIWDYEDLVSFPVKLLQNSNKHREKYNDQYQYVVVDEFQDTNPNQYEIIKLIASGQKNITVVGDDDQAIYSWRGASIRFLFDFEHDFPGTQIMKLEQNYRSSQPVLDFANNLIKKNSFRRTKSMWTEKKGGKPVFLLHSISKEEEATKIADLIVALQRSNPELFPIAILYRINSQSLAFETEFLQKNINFIILKGIRFFERKEIKDCIALLKLTFNLNDDISFLRIIGFLPLGIGPKTLEYLVQRSKEKKMSLFLTLKHFFKDKFSAKSVFTKIDKLHDNRENFKYSEILRILIDESNYIHFLENKMEQNRIFNIEELINFINGWELNNSETNISELIDRMVLESGRKKEKGKIPVYLLTMHNAKGTEFPLVIVTGINSSYMPFFLRKGKSEIEEERRLFYVGATRAIRQLIISDGSSKQSQFLADINPSLFQNIYNVDEILYYLKVAKKNHKKKSAERFLEHPIFGKGRIIKKIQGEQYLIDFEKRGEKLIDTSVVEVNFL